MPQVEECMECFEFVESGECMRSPNALAEKPANNLRWIMFKNHVNPPSPNILTIPETVRLCWQTDPIRVPKDYQYMRDVCNPCLFRSGGFSFTQPEAFRSWKADRPVELPWSVPLRTIRPENPVRR